MAYCLLIILAKEPRNQEDIIATYQRLIRSMPRANQYLLLYVLDLLSVFARKSDKNLMTATSMHSDVSRNYSLILFQIWL
jgi:RhoGAP domain